jgi:hypothetical protein
MANGHGGYRKPTSPAPVSGPGAKSRRTDGTPHGGPQPTRDLPDAKYGENKAFREAQGAAPMSTGMPDLSGIVPFGAPSLRPDEPITAGLPIGGGAGSSVAPALPANLSPEQQDRLRSYLPVLVVLASQDDVDPATKKFVRQLRAELG